MAKNKPKPAKHRSLSPDSVQKFVWSQLGRADVRTMAIVGAGFVEHELARSIVARLRPLSASEHNRLFEGYGALSSFSQKIDIGFALRIYGKVARKELEAIKAIRNEFAHNIRIKNFSHKKLRAECRTLLCHRYKMFLAKIIPGATRPSRDKTLRDRFLSSIIGMYVMLTTQRTRASRPPPAISLSLDSPEFRTWLETGVVPKIRVIRPRGGK